MKLLHTKWETGWTSLAAVILAAGLAGCTVEQTDEGELPDVNVEAREGELPEYEVIKKDEGQLPDVDVDVKGGDLPEYDVDLPDVDVKTRDVEVPVPEIDVKPADEEPDNR